MLEEETERSLWKRRQNLREQMFSEMQVNKLKFQNQTLSIETSFSFSSNFRYVLIFFSVFIWNSGQSIECKGQCPCPVCDCSKPRTVCQTNGNSFPGVKCYDPCRYCTSMITYHGNTRKTIPISSCNKPTNGVTVTERDYVNCSKKRFTNTSYTFGKRGNKKNKARRNNAVI